MILSKIIKNFAIYSCGSLFLRGVSIFITPLVMHHLTAEDYGLLGIANSFINIGAALVGLGLRQFLSIEYFRAHHHDRDTLILHTLNIYITIALPLFILMACYVDLINTTLFFNQAYPSLIIVTLLLLFGQFFVELLYQILQYQGKALLLTCVQSATALAIIIMNTTFLCIFNWGAFSPLAAQALSILCVICFTILWLKKNYKKRWIPLSQSLAHMQLFLRQSIPFIPRMLCAWMIASGDRWVLAHYGTLHDVGIYSVADLFAQLFHFLVIIPLSTAYLPYIMEQYHSAPHRIQATERRNLYLMTLCMLTLILLLPIGFWATTPFLYIIIPAHFHQALRHLPVLILGQIFLLGSHFASSFIQYQKKMFFLAFSLFIPALLNLMLNIALIPYFSIAGCVYATTLSYAIYFFITLAYNRWIMTTQVTPLRPIITPQSNEIPVHIFKAPED